MGAQMTKLHHVDHYVGLVAAALQWLELDQLFAQTRIDTSHEPLERCIGAAEFKG